MYEFQQQMIDRQTCKYSAFCQGALVSYAQALREWQADGQFLPRFIETLVDAPFSAYRWETPPITHDTANRPFEFVLIDSPRLTRTPDPHTFCEYFNNDPSDWGIVRFPSLGKDAWLIVPSPRGSNRPYGHLAEFVRHANMEQVRALWCTVAKTAQQHLTNRPLWINTAGGGVAWLHVRLDSTPKYYRYRPYKVVKT